MKQVLLFSSNDYESMNSLWNYYLTGLDFARLGLEDFRIRGLGLGLGGRGLGLASTIFDLPLSARPWT